MERMICLVVVAMLVVLAALSAGPESANASEPLWRDAADTAVFTAQAARLREQMQPDERYGGIGETERTEIERNLAALQRLFDARGSMAAMTPAERVELLNAQERINALLTGHDGDRMVCTREQQMGTRFRSTVCMTVRERERLRHTASDVTRRHQYNTDTKREGQ